MVAKTRRRSPRKVADSYLNLVVELPLTSIQSEQQYDRAQAMIDRLLAKGRLDRGERMYLDALSDLLGAYEDVYYAIAPVSDAQMLRHLMDAKGVDEDDVVRRTGIPRSLIEDILKGSKTLTWSLARKLSRFFEVDPSVLSPHL